MSIILKTDILETI